MADSKLSQADSQALMTRAMAYRIKYRVTDGIQMRLPIRNLGSHKMNRGGGVYSSGDRCKTLLEQILKIGFMKETVNHGAIAVEEPPFSEIPAMKEKKKTIRLELLTI